MDAKNQMWLVEISSQNGRLLATKNQLAKTALSRKLDAQQWKGTVAMVYIKKEAALNTALVTTKGELPVGVIPIIEDTSSSPDKKTPQVLWVNLGFSKPTNAPETQQNIPDQSATPDSTNTGNQNSDGSMTEKQRRFLFRLLAERNITGKQAENYMKKALNVTYLIQASKQKASELIEQLLEKGDG